MYLVSAWLKTERASAARPAPIRLFGWGMVGRGVVDLDVVDAPVGGDVDVVVVLVAGGADVRVAFAFALVAVALEELPEEPPQAPSPRASVRIDRNRMDAADPRRAMLMVDMKLLFR